MENLGFPGALVLVVGVVSPTLFSNVDDKEKKGDDIADEEADDDDFQGRDAGEVVLEGGSVVFGAPNFDVDRTVAAVALVVLLSVGGKVESTFPGVEDAPGDLLLTVFAPHGL